MSIVSPMDSMVPHYPQTGGDPDKGLISDSTGIMFAETPAPGESVQDQINALISQLSTINTQLTNSINAVGALATDIAESIGEHEYSVVYDANGGEGTPEDSNKYWFGDVVQIDFDTAPTLEGYTFLGYALTDDADSATYSEGGTTTLPIVNTIVNYINNNTITLYAVWEAEVTPDPDSTK